MNASNAPTSIIRDGDLIAEVAANDEGAAAAFEELARRHGPMVLDVCRRHLGDVQSAEDAAQATFFVLWRKAPSLRKRVCIAGWLHHVARNVCRNAARSRRARKTHEREAARMKQTSRAPQDRWAEIKDVLDEEIGRLPEKYRLPLILFHLEGRSIGDVAVLLGSKESTVATWLSRARELLCGRLSRQDVALSSSAVLTATLAAHASTEAVPEAFIASTSHAARLFAVSELTSGAAFAKTTLAEGTIRLMTLKTFTSAATAVAVALLPVGIVVTWAAMSVMAAEEAKQQRELRLIQGTWSVLELHQGEQESSEEEREHLQKRNFKIQITADEIIFLADESSTKYRLDTTRDPKVIEYLKDGKVVAKAIYKLEGDDLKICLGRTPDRGEPEAPTDFDSSKGPPGRFPTLFVMNRDKPAKEDEPAEE